MEVFVEITFNSVADAAIDTHNAASLKCQTHLSFPSNVSDEGMVKVIDPVVGSVWRSREEVRAKSGTRFEVHTSKQRRHPVLTRTVTSIYDACAQTSIQ